MIINTYILYFKVPTNKNNIWKSGKISQAVFLNCINSMNKKLSDKLHKSNLRRPYTTSRIYPAKKKFHGLNVGKIRYSILDRELNDTFEHFLTSESNIQIHNQRCDIVMVERMNDLISTSNDRPKIDTAIHFRVKTPAILSSSLRKSNVDPFPYPKSIWENILNTWSELVSPIDEENKSKFLDAIQTQIATPTFDFKSVRIPVGKNATQPGFLGYILFLVEDNTNLELLIPLAKFANLWGLGAKKTRGYGYCEIDIVE